MDITPFVLDRKEAYKLWKEYVSVCKGNPKDKFLEDMKKVYHQLKCGQKVIDIYTVFQRSGLNFNGEPRLAIARATTKTITCFYRYDGQVIFIDKFDKWSNRHWKEIDSIRIKKIFPEIPREKQQQYQSEIKLEAPVPSIPASLRPKGKLGNNYYILWEVEKWTRIPPRDPYLLRRLTENMFVVVAGWKLTELERAVMKGRVW